MIAELGHLALILALGLAVAQSVLPLWGARLGAGRGEVLMRAGSSLAAGQLVFVATAFACLLWSFAISDFSVSNVVANSHSTKPFVYKLAGAWGNHEGSMVLWVLILALCGGAVAGLGRGLPSVLKADVLAVLGMIAAGFLAFTVFTSNPFERVWPPALDGQGLNPVLQDPALAIHPPMLYLGYVGTAVAFAFAVAALIEGRVDAAWGRWVRPWALAAWVSLTAGIALGSWWAYYELGWGGFWFWDPVENASFMPWLLTTALLHSAIVVEKRDALKVWTILLAILAFALSLLGTFLVRSGVLNSVHAFANDPERGAFILGLLLVTVVGALVLFAWRAPKLAPSGVFAPISREGALVLNNLILATSCAVVFVGTLYPMFADLLLGAKITVGAPWFNIAFLPLMVPLLLAMGVGPLLSWKRSDLPGVLGRLKAAAAVALLVFAVSLWLAGAPVLPAGGFLLAAWLVGGVATDVAARIGLGRVGLGTALRRLGGLPRSFIGASVAHAGMAVLAAGIAGSGLHQERTALLRQGDAIEVAGYTVRLEGVRPVSGSNWQGLEASLGVFREGERIATMTPQKRSFPVERQSTSEASIRTTGFSDLYTVLGDQDGAATVIRVHVNPLAPWIFLGAWIMALGGIVSLADRRYRVGAPARRAPLAAAVPAE